MPRIPPSALKRARSKHDYTARTATEISLAKGARVYVIKAVGQWWYVECNGHFGYAPPSYILVDSNEQNKMFWASTLYESDSLTPEELVFKEGEEVLIVENEDPEWWYGISSDFKRAGYLPCAYVTKIEENEDNEIIQEKIRSLRNTSRPAKPAEATLRGIKNKDMEEMKRLALLDLEDERNKQTASSQKSTSTAEVVSSDDSVTSDPPKEKVKRKHKQSRSNSKTKGSSSNPESTKISEVSASTNSEPLTGAAVVEDDEIHLDDGKLKEGRTQSIVEVSSRTEERTLTKMDSKSMDSVILSSFGSKETSSTNISPVSGSPTGSHKGRHRDRGPSKYDQKPTKLITKSSIASGPASAANDLDSFAFMK